MRRRELGSILVFALAVAVLVVAALIGGGARPLKIAVLAVIVAVILATRLGPRSR